MASVNTKRGVIGILTGGGDVPGLNPAIRAVTLRAIREGYGLTQDALEQLLRVGPKTVVRWERGTVCQSAAVDTLLAVLRDEPAAAAQREIC